MTMETRFDICRPGTEKSDTALSDTRDIRYPLSLCSNYRSCL